MTGSIKQTRLEDGGERYRWSIVGISFVAMLFTWGTPFSFGVVSEPLLVKFELSRIQVSSVYSGMLFALYALSGLVGIVASHLRVRSVFFIGSIVITACAIGFLFVSSYTGLILVFVTLGTVLGAAYILIVAMIPLWFSKREATAMGIVFAGNGFGIQVMPPIWEWSIATYGINQAFLVINLVTAAVFFVVGLVVYRPQSEVNSNQPSLSCVLGWINRQLRRPRFLAAFLGTGLLFAWYYMLTAQAVPFFVDRGTDRTTAAFLFGLVGGVSVPTRVVSGVIADHVGPRRTIALTTALVGASFFLFLSSSWLAIYVGIVIFGIGFGFVAPLYLPALLIGFEVPSQTAFVGLFNFALATFALATPLFSSLVVDFTGGYEMLLALTGLATIAGAILFWIGSGGPTTRV